MSRRVLVVLLLALGTPLAAQGNRIDAWVGGGLASASRHAAVAGSVGTATGSGPFVEGGLRYRFLRLDVRQFSTAFVADSGVEAVGDLGSMEGVLSVGTSRVGASVGAGVRGFEGALTARSFRYLLAGVRVELPVGNSGLTAGLIAQTAVGGKEVDGPATATGRMAETSLRYHLRSLPAYLLLSYRLEQFSVEDASAFPDELATIRLGGGIIVRR